MRARAGRIAASVVLVLGAGVACAPPAPDLVLLNARVFTVNRDAPWAEALAIRGDRIVAVGTTTEVGALGGPSTVRRDVGGRTVLPGFNDAHVSDPGLDGPALRRFMQAAIETGVTSMQWFVAHRTVRQAGVALVEADTPVRVRVLRMPRPGPDGVTIDSRPHLPPQPGGHVDIRGMAFVFGPADGQRLRQAVGWGYGTEDLLAIEAASDAALEEYVATVERTGLAEVWLRKRPRVERAGAAAAAMTARLRAEGMVVVQRPDGLLPLESLRRSGVHLALGSGRGANPVETVAWATSAEQGVEALTREEAVFAGTRGSAYAEHSEREKGHLGIGALADLFVPSVDPFTTSTEELVRARSILTIIGGRVVHDVP